VIFWRGGKVSKSREKVQEGDGGSVCSASEGVRGKRIDWEKGWNGTTAKRKRENQGDEKVGSVTDGGVRKVYQNEKVKGTDKAQGHSQIRDGVGKKKEHRGKDSHFGSITPTAMIKIE